MIGLRARPCARAWITSCWQDSWLCRANLALPGTWTEHGARWRLVCRPRAGQACRGVLVMQQPQPEHGGEPEDQCADASAGQGPCGAAATTDMVWGCSSCWPGPGWPPGHQTGPAGPLQQAGLADQASPVGEEASALAMMESVPTISWPDWGNPMPTQPSLLAAIPTAMTALAPDGVRV